VISVSLAASRPAQEPTSARNVDMARIQAALQPCLCVPRVLLAGSKMGLARLDAATVQLVGISLSKVNRVVLIVSLGCMRRLKDYRLA